MREVDTAFGFKHGGRGALTMTKQPGGKLNYANERKRKQLIWQLSEKFRIFSLGRYAIWKPIRSDQAVADLEVIKRLMTSYEQADQYAVAHSKGAAHES